VAPAVGKTRTNTPLTLKRAGMLGSNQGCTGHFLFLGIGTSVVDTCRGKSGAALKVAGSAQGDAPPSADSSTDYSADSSTDSRPVEPKPIGGKGTIQS